MAKSVVGAVPASRNVYVDALLWGGNRWDPKSGPVTYAFDTNRNQVLQGDDGKIESLKVTVEAWQAAEKAAVKLALASFSNVANISFAESKTAASANLQLSKGRIDDPRAAGALAFMVTPGEFNEGKAFFNVAGHPDWSGQLAQGGFSFATLIHELGHGIGLAHPHDDGGKSGRFPGVDGYDESGLPRLDGEGDLDFEGDTGDNGLNIGLFTMMSYNSIGQLYAPAAHSNFGIEGTPMALDVAALQHLYGANMSHRTGNDTYRLPQADDVGTFWSCIWDAGGLDTISNAGSSRAAVIDLRPAPLVGAKAGGYASAVADGSVHGGFTIANGVTVENAIGGRAGDRLIGNDAANRLDGGAGADVMAGGRGNDTYLVDHRGDMVLEVRGQGRDTVVSTVSYHLAEGTEIETLELARSTGTAALDLGGNGFANTLRGNDGNNVLDGGGGADTLVGGTGNDVYIVDNRGDRIVEAVRGGTDKVLCSVSYTLRADQEVEALQLLSWTGRARLDLEGNAFGQTLVGNNGANSLNGGLGNDVLIGRGGADTFVFAGKLGANNIDRIADFAGEDTIRLSDDIFEALAPGALAAGAFKNLDKARIDADDRILYKQSTGELFYDADGSGKAAAVKFAVLDNKAALTHADFFVV